jgi:hypothetical protein
MSLIALYYLCSVGIYYNVYRFKKHGAPTHDNNIIKMLTLKYFFCYIWSKLKRTGSQITSIFLRFKLEVFILRRQRNGAKYSESEIKNGNFTSEIIVFI